MVANATVFISIFGATSGLMASKVGNGGGGHVLGCGGALRTGWQDLPLTPLPPRFLT